MKNYKYHTGLDGSYLVTNFRDHIENATTKSRGTEFKIDLLKKGMKTDVGNMYF